MAEELSRIVEREEALDVVDGVAKLLFSQACVIASAHGMSGPNAVGLMACALGLIMIENETTTAAKLLRAVADLVESGAYSAALEAKVSDALMAYTLANSTFESGKQ